jgi:beta-1,4-N-acetylglucosaminyltransferase
MIFITVGTDTHQFDRLLEEVDRLIESKAIREKVVAQTGNSTYEPKLYRHKKFLESDEMMRLIKASDMVISHAGIGSIITIKENRKPLVIVPRLRKFGEHTDDHQVQVAKELEKQKKAVSVFDISDLQAALVKARKTKIKGLETTKISEIVSEYLSKVEME